MTGNFRCMPSDFADHAGEGLEKLMKRYHAGAEAVRRWKQICGTLRPWGRSVIRVDDEGNRKFYATIGKAAESIFNGKVSNIYAAIRANGTAYGYRWYYADE